jgi:hypothetical protein
MTNAEQHHLLHPDQHGSRKGKMSISAVLLKRLSHDIIRQAQMDAVMLNNDASTCYDRMIPSLVMLKCRRAGMSREAAKVVLTLLQNMKYYVRTAYGISPEAFPTSLITFLASSKVPVTHAQAGPSQAVSCSTKWKTLPVPLFTQSAPTNNHDVPAQPLLMIPPSGSFTAAWIFCLPPHKCKHLPNNGNDYSMPLADP